MSSTAQSLAALDKANSVRMLKAAFKRSVAAQNADMGKLMVREAIGNPPVELFRVRVEELLRSIHRVGDEKARAVLRRAEMSPRRRLGELTDRERTKLDEVLR